MVPGTAMQLRAISSRERCSRATNIGPYPSPMLAPEGSSAYWPQT